jgi:hypothetical protein
VSASRRGRTANSRPPAAVGTRGLERASRQRPVASRTLRSLGALALLLLGAGAAAAAAATQGHAFSPPTAHAPTSERSSEVLRLDCFNRLGRREVTLFGNGTIRLRDGSIGAEWMGLAELGPDELQGILRRLEDEDLSEIGDLPRGVAGDWVEKCDLVVDLPGRKRQKLSYGRYDPLPLGVSRLQRIAEQLGARVRVLSDTEQQLPEHYEPRLGDVLKRFDGNSFRVVNFTSDRKGVELDGLVQPVHLIVLKEQLRMEFVALLAREP